ncbi:leptomycin B resistance protein pmd1 [Xylogone sp. PMI_703]|nr:leptomycin B resistance protein pmd1 [Xylogone sp. PMI_703]
MKLQLDQYQDTSVDEEKKQTLPTLTNHERSVIEKQLNVSEVKLGYFDLYRYAARKDLAIIITSVIFSAAAGAVLPLMTVVFGQFAGHFTNYQSGEISRSYFNHQLRTYALYFVYLGIGSFFSVFIMIFGLSYTGERITQKIRESYLKAILRQNIAFFDQLGSGEVATRISADMNLIQDGISQKVGLTVTGISTFFAALIVSFTKSWKLSLIMLSVVVSIIVVMGGIGKFMKRFQTDSLRFTAQAGTIAEEAFASIRTVTAYGAQDYMTEKYKHQARQAMAFDYKGKAALGLMIASMMAIMNLQYGLAFWQGGRFIKDGELTLPKALTVLLASMMGAVSIGHIAPHFGSFAMAVAAAHKVYEVIDRTSPIDPEYDSGESLTKVNGDVSFHDIRHIYPSRPEQTILEGLTFTAPAGKITAIVGHSGSGKSTVISLLERFYFPVSGKICLDGRDIQDLNLRWLRSQMSLVSQEPVLFSTTIYRNIEYGLMGTRFEKADEDTKSRLINEAAKVANAYEFIISLPNGFQTQVGDRGSLLSGGQKQRIAIARAIISNPPVLLLDEATAALDTKSEAAVQIALQNAGRGRTTITIAHRLSSIRNSDKIIVLDRGRVVEEGTHDELSSLQGIYHNLLQSQQIQFQSPYSSGEIETQLDERYHASSVAKGSENQVLNIGSKTQASTVDRCSEIQTETSYSTFDLIKFIWSMNVPEKRYLAIGLSCSIICGVGYPSTAIFFGNACQFWASMFLMLGIVLFIAYLVQGLAFAFASSRLILRARIQALRSILRQDISLFDLQENSSGSLSAFLSNETHQLAGISGATLGAILNSGFTVIAAIIISCIYAWRIGLVCASTIPVLLSCGFLRFWTLSKMEQHTKKETEAAADACEATSSLRTVLSLTLERCIWDNYHKKLEHQFRENMWFVSVSSLLYASSQSLNLFAMALAVWYGGTLILKHEYITQQFFVCFVAVIWGSQAATGVFSFAPDMGSSKGAASRLKSLLSRVPLIDSWSNDGVNLKNLEGLIEFKDIKFSYPTRKDKQVLERIDLVAKPGQFTAIVGASGSGKSTIISLLERFYEPSSGSILIDGKEIATLNIKNYRSKMALVSQDNMLHMGSIKENIIAGKKDVSEDDIVAACKDANIYDFIMSLPNGLNTLVGAKGGLLSGGQRQRIAIAKALLRDPKILLLDEATSALDSESEKSVQIALDRASNGRTTIAIAHRLSTIRKADCIYVLSHGRVAESGNHDELIDQHGLYWELVRLQNLGGNIK